MGMKKFDAEKIFFDKLTGFLLSHFQMTAPNIVDSAHFVKSTPLRAFTKPFQHFADMVQTY